mmetsp:Transcript_83970/g.270501  ORF Transcript_83970/g.270501 Transcript_83970/m.270501 type:complete len:336 (-) Transcript_83970:34-1041(-)
MGAATMDVLGDGRLLKEVIQVGDGPVPDEGSWAKIRYRCCLAAEAGGSGAVLDDSSARGKPFVFTLGQDEVILGLEHGVSSMKTGERASFVVHPDLAYGAAGCGGGALPGVPPGSGGDGALGGPGAVRLEVELLEVGCGGAGASGADGEEAPVLSPEERLQRAMIAKDVGNTDFKRGELSRASSAYESALQLVGFIGADPDVEDVSWADAARREARDKLAVSCFLNLAQCELKLELFLEAEGHSTAALDIEPANSKAIYRRGLARMHLGLLVQARSDLAEAARREPLSAEVRSQLQECTRRLQASDQRERSTFGGMFGRGSMYPEKDADPSHSGD